mmetsp:Transcript_8015/g.29626  ORF Transcript_8015/g.29626 Transcript_8015/m.29626 type:complete len:130 (-) Transcript_8015:287-676(-)
MGVIVWVAVMTLLVLHLLDNIEPFNPLFEFIGFSLFSLMTFIAFCVGAADCDSTTSFSLLSDDSFEPSVCKEASGAKASLVFCFFLWMELAGSAVLAFITWRRQSAGNSGGKQGYFQETGGDQEAPVFE